MTSISRLLACVAVCLAIATPAAAQLAGTSGAGSPESAPTPQPRVPDIAPAGVPGIGAAPVATGPSLQKAVTGDPTSALFTAINSGDYGGAQDAVARGANIGAQNDLGESPLDLSIALNRTQITFMLLSTRNEGGGTDVAAGPPPPAAKHKMTARVSTPPVKIKPPVMGDAPGTPDPAAGFVGFGK